jgi:hypothetical protein
MSSLLRKWMLEWSISKEGWSWVKHSIFGRMLMDFYGSSITLWSQRTLSFAARSWMRLIALDTLFIQEPTRCIKTWRRVSRGWGWREKLQSMYLSVTHCEESRPIIQDPPKTYNPGAFSSENGKTFVWTSLWVCLAPRVGTTRYGSCTGSNSMPSSTCQILSAIMVFWRPLSLMEDLSLWLIFGNNYMTVWAPISFKAQHIILRLTGRLNESIKSLKIWFMLVLWTMVRNGTSTFH